MTTTPHEEPREHGGCMVTWMLFLIIGNALLAFASLVDDVPVAATLNALTVIGAIGLWAWRRWGYALVVVGAVGAAVMGLTQNDLLSAALGAMLLIFTVIVVQPNIEQFR